MSDIDKFEEKELTKKRMFPKTLGTIGTIGYLTIFLSS